MLDLIGKLLLCTDLVVVAEGEASTTLVVILAVIAAVLFLVATFAGDAPFTIRRRA